jgi:hypothetical protein
MMVHQDPSGGRATLAGNHPAERSNRLALWPALNRNMTAHPFDRATLSRKITTRPFDRPASNRQVQVAPASGARRNESSQVQAAAVRFWSDWLNEFTARNARMGFPR